MSKEISFEEAINQLEMTVEKLESGQNTLEESIKLFNKGTLMASICEEKLKKAESTIQEII